jgi:hypothetical protein
MGMLLCGNGHHALPIVLITVELRTSLLGLMRVERQASECKWRSPATSHDVLFIAESDPRRQSSMTFVMEQD